MAGPPVGGGVGQAHAFEDPGIVARGFHAFDMYGNILEVPFPGGMFDATGQYVANAFASCDHVQQLRDFIDVAVVYLKIHLAPQVGFNGKSAQVAGRNGVDANPVADIIQISDFFNAVDHTEPAKGINGLIFRAFQFQACMAAFFNGCHPAAGHQAFGTGTRFDITLRVQTVGTDVLPFVIVALSPVTGGECIGIVGHLDQLGCAHTLVGLHTWVVLGFRHDGFGKLDYGNFVKKRSHTIALKQQAFNFFSAQNGSHARPSGRTPVVVFNDAKTHPVFSCRPDHHSTGFTKTLVRLAEALQDLVFGSIGLLAPQIRGRVEKHLFRMDAQNDGDLTLPLDDNGIISGGIHGLWDLAPGIGFRI